MKEWKTALVTAILVGLVGALGFVVWQNQDTKEVKDLKAKIHDFKILKAERQLELDIFKLQKEIAQYTARPQQKPLTPQDMGGEFVPIEKMSPEEKAKAR